MASKCLYCFSFILNFVLISTGTIKNGLPEQVPDLGSLPNEIVYKVLPGQVIADFTGDYLQPIESTAPQDIGPVSITKREATPSNHVIEIFFIADRAAYQKWLKLENGNIQAADRRMKVFYDWIAKSMNQRYNYVAKMSNSINSLQIRSVGLLILKDAAPSWTELTKLDNGRVNATLALKKLGEWLRERTDIPKNDHIMAFTGYGLQKGGNAEVKGISTLNALCTESSMAIIHDDMTSSIPAVASHELGHSLGASHDQDSNGCSDEDNYIMATKLKFPKSELVASRPWQFSICSIKTFEETFSRVTCTKVAEAPTVSEEVHSAGQVFTADEQCKMANDEDSYISRNLHFKEGHENMCRGMYCEIANSTTVSVRLPLDGTSCGHKKWCQMGRCVNNQKAPIKINNCPSGDNPRFVCHINHCSIYAMTERKYQCCETCPVSAAEEQTSSLRITKTTVTPNPQEIPSDRGTEVSDLGTTNGQVRLDIADNGVPTKVVNGNIIIADSRRSRPTVTVPNTPKEDTRGTISAGPEVPKDENVSVSNDLKDQPGNKSPKGNVRITGSISLGSKPLKPVTNPPIVITNRVSRPNNGQIGLSGTLKVLSSDDKQTLNIPKSKPGTIKLVPYNRVTQGKNSLLGGTKGRRLVPEDNFWNVFNRWFNRCALKTRKAAENLLRNYYAYQDMLYRRLNKAFNDWLEKALPEPKPQNPPPPPPLTKPQPLQPLPRSPILLSMRSNINPRPLLLPGLRMTRRRNGSNMAIMALVGK